MEAQYLSDLVHHSLFGGPEFRRILYSKDPPLSEDNIQLVQAAMLMMVLQAAREVFDINRRIRTQCFPALVSVIRSLGLTRVLNGTEHYGQPAILDDYVHQETLVRIISWAYLFDSYIVIYHRSPPHFKIVEANFGLPRHDALFDTIDHAEWESVIPNTDRYYSPVSLKVVVQQLMDDQPIHPNEMLRHINTLFALSLVLSALHSILFDIQALGSFIYATNALIPIERALDRWKELYDMFYPDFRTSKASRSGFMIHSLEFWWLAKRFVQRPDVALNGENFAADFIKSFHGIVQELKASNEDG
ncbi:uncharacterized protein KD926_006916 [Aspergillus affinis]|uniref:uncharacterized protein n=1 Tax=Aspergillus affinis TaxID=1070780 RepID=UPI0022FE82B5|nr:uncharacterized protein KD926_006916 [Aspergillus affinis]KAI9041340.1 hypothetical protein KD926_006916 [Aspergillus affinis]